MIAGLHFASSQFLLLPVKSTYFHLFHKNLIHLLQMSKPLQLSIWSNTSSQRGNFSCPMFRFGLKITLVLFYREVRLTIPEAEKNDFKAVCSKLMSRYPDELAEGSLSQSEFKKIQVKHFNLWSEKAYVKKLPVRYIGLQVHTCLLV